MFLANSLIKNDIAKFKNMCIACFLFFIVSSKMIDTASKKLAPARFVISVKILVKLSVRIFNINEWNCVSRVCVVFVSTNIDRIINSMVFIATIIIDFLFTHWKAIVLLVVALIEVVSSFVVIIKLPKNKYSYG